MSRRNTLFVGGLSRTTRAKEVAHEFERFGSLVRCDIPTPNGQSRGYAFIEFNDDRCAYDAYQALRGRSVCGRNITLEWAKHAPARGWRFEMNESELDRGAARHNTSYRERSPSPRRRSPPRRSRRSPSPRGRGLSPPRRSSPPPPAYRRGRSPSPLPPRGGGYRRPSPAPRSPSPARRVSPGEKRRRSPPPVSRRDSRSPKRRRTSLSPVRRDNGRAGSPPRRSPGSHSPRSD